MNELSEEAIDTLVDHTATITSPFSVILMRREGSQKPSSRLSEEGGLCTCKRTSENDPSTYSGE